MSDYAIIFQVLGAVVALFVIFLTYMNTKTWRWVHVTFTFLVFVASFTFCVYAAMTMKTRVAWIKLHDKLAADLAKTQTELEQVTRGDPKDFEGKTPSLFSLREDLYRTILDRGRVWRGCAANINRQTGAITIMTSPPPDPANPAPAAAAKKHNIQAKTILHAFREVEFRPDPQNQEKVIIVPAAYIGEFRATPTGDQTLTLEATMPLSNEQTAAALANVNPGTWALYESAPVDGHEWIVAEKDEQGVSHVRPLEGAIQAAVLLERAQIPPQLAQQIMAPYLRDGQEIPADDNSVPPENVWYEVKFEKEHEVNVDAPVVNAAEAEPFNTEGQAVLPRLRRGDAAAEDSGKVKFSPSDTAFLDQETATALAEQQIVTLVKKIYRRKLTDYERKFHSMNERTNEINGRISQLQLDKAAMIASTQKAEQQRALVEEFKVKANDDLTKVKYELTELEKYRAALSGRLTAVQTDLSQLYRANKAISRELADTSARLTEEINRRTREATARTP